MKREMRAANRNSRHHCQQGLARLTVVYLILALGIGGGLVALYHIYTYGRAYTAAGSFRYPEPGSAMANRSSAQPRRCAPGIGEVADHLKMKSANKLRFTVTTPANYRSGYAHPLLVVWAPSGFSESLAEKFTGLTAAATVAGFVVVHVRSVPLGIKALAGLATVPEEVVTKWCIDTNKIFYTGHSDGGTVSNALAILPVRSVRPAAIAPSAMGMQEKDLAEYQCPAPTAVMLMHNLGDGHFPNYGDGVAQWWARCNGCAQETSPSPFNDCVEYRDCAAAGRTLYCRAEGSHAHWPGLHHDVIGFFTAIVEQGR